jgi:chromate transporter
MPAIQVFLVFLRLGLTSFGGPVAHLGYFREEFVAKRRWISDADYAELVALCQFLPGPASSQVGFAIGRRRAGLAGALAAFLGFTLPSFLVMAVLAISLERLDPDLIGPFIRGLTIAAVAVVLHAVVGMAKSLCPDWPRRLFAIAIGAALLFAAHPLAQITAVAVGLAAGPLLVRDGPLPPKPDQSHGGKAFALVCGLLFAAGLIAGPLLADRDPTGTAALASSFFRAGALVFGGGHVVLPLLETEMTSQGWMALSDVLTGYAAAQALPGPLFALSAYLGALAASGPGDMAGAALATLAIFAPGFLILLAAEPFWAGIRAAPLAQCAVAGANAAVVGLLGAALINPIASSALTLASEAAIALGLYILLRCAKAAPLLIVALGAGAGFALSAFPPPF